jgi:peptidoglycan/xylan/chitin deacetylase (PgdA/CDA1 family)
MPFIFFLGTDHVSSRRVQVQRILKNTIYQGVRWTGLVPVMCRLFAGRAVILAFHEIHRDCRSELMTGTSIQLLEYGIKWLRREGWDIVKLDHCLDRLSNCDQERRYAVLTFDDGFRDNLSVALPILEQFNTPFMMYVPTCALTRTMQSWWLALRELFRFHDRVTIDALGIRFECSDLRSKISGLAKVTRWVHGDYHRVSALIPDLRRAGISFHELNERYFLDERQLQELARHPLVSIGGHTTSHPALKNLDTAAARAEMIDNRTYLEGLLDLPVLHFAYPYGGSQSYGSREEELANEVGFRTAVTTRQEQIGCSQPNYFALPRIVIGEFDTKSSFQTRISGAQRPIAKLLSR